MNLIGRFLFYGHIWPSFIINLNRLFNHFGCLIDIGWFMEQIFSFEYAITGSLIQYKTHPGIHTFMVYVQGRWGVAKGEHKPGMTQKFIRGDTLSPGEEVSFAETVKVYRSRLYDIS